MSSTLDLPLSLWYLGYMNQAIIIIFISQMILVTFSVASIYFLGYNDLNKFPYAYPKNSTGTSSIMPMWLELWFIYLLLYNQFIPLSLYVTIEIVNLGQGYLVGSDRELYHPGLDMPCSVRSSNLCQELGMVRWRAWLLCFMGCYDYLSEITENDTSQTISLVSLLAHFWIPSW